MCRGHTFIKIIKIKFTRGENRLSLKACQYCLIGQHQLLTYCFDKYLPLDQVAHEDAVFTNLIFKPFKKFIC